MTYTEARQIIEERGKTWNDFIDFMQDKPYEVDPNTHFILYPTKTVYQFVHKK